MLTVTDEVLLDSVIFKGGHIKFVTQNRTDLIAEDPSNAVPKGIDSLIIYNNQNSVVNSYSFGTSYFSSTAGTNNQERLKLDSVTDLSSKKYSFSYNEQITLPKKTSSSVDHWGYYNGANNEEFDDYAAIPIIMYESGIDTIIYAGANREASEEMAKAAILNRIGYPTGGYTEFSYELNDFSNRSFKIIGYETETGTITGGDIDTLELNTASGIFFQLTFTNNDDSCPWEGGTCDSIYGFNNAYCYTNYLELQQEQSDGTWETIYNYQYRDFPCFDDNSNSETIGYNKTLSAGRYRVLVNSFETLSCVCNYRYLYPASTTEYNKGGGLRIKAIANSDGEDISTTYYDYTMQSGDEIISSGKLMSKPLYHYTIPSDFAKGPRRVPVGEYVRINNDLLTLSGNYTNNDRLFTLRCNYTKASSETIKPLGTSAQGNPVGYCKVTVTKESDGDNGKTVHYYSNDAEYAPLLNTGMRYDDMLSFPGIPNLVHSSNGNLLKTEYWDAQEQLLKEEMYEYERLDSMYNIQGIKLYSIGTILGDNDDGSTPISISDYLVRFYDNVSERWNLIKDSTITYAYVGSTASEIKQVNNYYYDNYTHRQLTRKITTNSDGTSVTTTYKYPHDVTTLSGDAEAGRQKLVDVWNIKAILEEDLTIGETTQITQTEYESDFGLPRYIKRNTGDGQSLETRVEFIDYDDNGNLIKLHTEDDLYHYYIWGYNTQYPIAKIITSVDIAISVTIDDNSFSNSSDYVSVNSDVNYLKGQLSTYIENNDYHVYLYTYKPLVGMTSQTDPAGRTTYYEYDEFGRLETVLDNDGNIINTYKYNYAQ